MSVYDRIVGRRPLSPLIRVPKPVPRVVELEDEGSFALTIQQAEGVRRNAPGQGERRQICAVVIVVSNDGTNWRDAETYWRGPWRPSWEGGIPLPRQEDLIEVGRLNRARFARSQVRTTI